MNRPVLLTGLLSTLLLFCLVAGASAVELSERDNGRTITLPLGEPLVVSLDGNPTTGYLWELVNYNRDLLALKGESGFIRDADRPGAGGRFIFRFEPKAAGDTRLQLAYIRPWEKKIRPAMAFEVVISIPATGTEPVQPVIKSQPIFSRIDDQSLLRVTREAPHQVVSALGWSFAPLGQYAAGKRKGSEELLISRGLQSALKLGVPAFKNRTLDARWLNAKLLYIELWFNPHNGAYWILDVEQERMLAHELMNDGMLPQ